MTIPFHFLKPLSATPLLQIDRGGEYEKKKVITNLIHLTRLFEFILDLNFNTILKHLCGFATKCRVLELFSKDVIPKFFPISKFHAFKHRRQRLISMLENRYNLGEL
jgi:hypothetical protein